MKYQQNVFVLSILISITSYSLSHAQLYRGNICHNKAKERDGICEKIDKCDSTIIDLKEGKLAQTCGYEGRMTIVCCVGSTPSKTTTPSTTTTSRTTPGIANRNVGDIAKQKCKDYEELAWIRETSSILFPGQEFAKNSICPWEPGDAPVIIGGKDAKKGEFPHMALVGYTTDNGAVFWRCAGSLISENFVIIAAQCLASRDYGSPTTVRLGDLNYTDSSDDKSAQQIEIANTYAHPDYKPPINYNDIALLKLAKPAKLDIYVKPICLYPSETVMYEKALVTGWGYSEYGGNRNDLLMKIDLDIFSTAQCNTTYRNDRRPLPHGIDETLQLCAGDTCQSDGGSPIQVHSNNSELRCSYFLLGVTSFGKRCDLPNIPVIYTKIFPYMEWIENIVWPPTTTTPITTHVITRTNVGDKAKQKCKDYEELSWIREWSHILIAGEQFTKESICPWKPGDTPVAIGGEAAKKGEFPHMALVGYKTDNGAVHWGCGGSLISENFVITVAHCVKHPRHGPVTTVRLGDLNYKDPSDDNSAQQIEIANIYAHPDYKPPIYYNDIALLKLAKPAKLDIYVKPICLYQSEILKYEQALVTGWGRTESGFSNNLLMKAAMNISSTVECNIAYRKHSTQFPVGVDETLQLCAGDTCQSDGGGPIQVRSNNNDLHCSYFLLGVFSVGARVCGLTNTSVIYTKIFPYMEWIENIVWP